MNLALYDLRENVFHQPHLPETHHTNFNKHFSLMEEVKSNLRK